MFGRRRRPQGTQEAGGERKKFVAREDLQAFFVQFADEAEQLVLKKYELECAIDAGSRQDLERPMDDAAFRSQVGQLRTQIAAAKRKKTEETGTDWFGPFDGWFKQYVNEPGTYDAASDFAKQHDADEDWPGSLIYIVLGGEQAAKHTVLSRWAEFAGMPVVETKTGFRPIYEAVLKKLEEGTPKRGTMTASEFLEAKAKSDETVRYFRRKRRDIEEWLGIVERRQTGAGTTPQAPPVKSPKEVLTEELSELRTKLQGLREKMGKDAVEGVAAEELGKMAESMASIAKNIREKQEMLDKLTKPATQPAPSRLEQVGNIVVMDPVVTSPITTVGESQRDKLVKELEKAMAAKAEIARIENELKKLDDAEKKAATEARKTAAQKPPTNRKSKAAGKEPAKPSGDGAAENTAQAHIVKLDGLLMAAITAKNRELVVPLTGLVKSAKGFIAVKGEDEATINMVADAVADAETGDATKIQETAETLAALAM